MTILTIVLILIGIAAIFVGFMLIRGYWRIPEDKKEKVAIGSIVLAIVVGIGSWLFTSNPDWLESLRERLARNTES